MAVEECTWSRVQPMKEEACSWKREQHRVLMMVQHKVLMKVQHKAPRRVQLEPRMEQHKEQKTPYHEHCDGGSQRQQSW